MFDIGSYRSAIDVLEGNQRTTPRPAPRAAPRTRQRPPPTYESATRQERVSHSYGDRDYDGDWLSVPVNGESQGHSNTRSRSSEGRNNGWTSVRQSDAYQPGARRHVQSHSYRSNEEYDDNILPISNGVRSLAIGGGRQRSQRQNHDVEASRRNGFTSRYDDSYHNDGYRSTGNLSYKGETRPREMVSHVRSANGNSFASTSDWEEAGHRPSQRMIYNGRQDQKMNRRSLGAAARGPPEERKFLSDVQKELEFQRQNWKGEIDKMTGSLLSSESSSQMAMKSSYVDTSGPQPRFIAFIDIREFPPTSVTVNVDKISNKIIVEAKQTGGAGSVAKTFTQKVQMPRFADETRLTARMNRDGILKVDVPLIYYFPQEELTGDKTKSFVYEVRENGDGTKTMEILVKPGKDLRIEDLRVGLEHDKLIIYAERFGDSGNVQRQTIKKYTLPENADVDGISSHSTGDGCLTILVPILERSYR